MEHIIYIEGADKKKKDLFTLIGARDSKDAYSYLYNDEVFYTSLMSICKKCGGAHVHVYDRYGADYITNIDQEGEEK